ncbi:MAG: type II toxin-antitoxin system PemK/MazF family toxin [Planctomycetes bacterium]|nr:type II toxin-antitoxin system PemK/MazF family toxin [Planctomycetota bacterium]
MARTEAARGEIWLVDLGFTQKTRPVVVMNVRYLDNERAVITYVARTTSMRGTPSKCHTMNITSNPACSMRRPSVLSLMQDLSGN